MAEKTKKVFYDNQYLTTLKANVVDVIEKNNNFHVVLNETIFFQGGGGQPSDTGKIGGIDVIEVYEEDGVVYHVLEKKPLKTEGIKCEIDFNNRLDGMQQHLGQHVLSGCFFGLFNANTVGFHLGKEISTVDIMGFLEEDKIREAEEMANNMIARNLKVNFLTPTKQELRKLKLRRALPKTNEEIRVVEIEDLDINACCGVHPSSTIELQVIKIKKWEKNKGNTRIEFLAGKRAVSDYMNKDSILREICMGLNAGEDDVIKTISNLHQNTKSLSEENRKLKNDLSNYEIKEIISNGECVKGVNIIAEIFEGEEVRYISKLATKITDEDNNIVLFGSKFDDRGNMLFASSKNLKISMNDLLKDAVTLINGKGGGNMFLAQGAGKAKGSMELAIDYAKNKVKNSL